MELLAMIALALLLYAAACLAFPFARCMRCHGDGRIRSKAGRTWRRCKWCKGTGQRRRAGTVLLVALRGTRQRVKGDDR